MQSPFRLILLVVCTWLLVGQSGCGIFKGGGCDCPAFSQQESAPSDESMECDAELVAVNLPG